MNVLLDDLQLATSHVAAHAMNELPERVREAAADALRRGGQVEVRVRPSAPEHFSVWVVSGEGAQREALLVTLDQPLDS